MTFSRIDRRVRPLLVFLWLLTPAALAASPASAGSAVAPEEVAGPESWGGLEGVMRVRHLALAAQPDQAALEAAHGRGAVAVVNLRAPSEQEGLGFDERAAVERLGMAYYQVPVAGPEPFDAATLAAIDAAVKAHEGDVVLIHCATGNRAAGWLALHLADDHGMGLEDALEVARRAGLRSPELEQKVRRAAQPETKPSP